MERPEFAEPGTPEVGVVEIKYAYWASESGQVFAFAEDGSEDAFKPEGLTRMTDEQIEAHLNKKPYLWTNGVEFREALEMELPGWYRVPDEEVEATQDALRLAKVKEQTAVLRAEADQAIAPLQDAVDLDEASTQEAQMLKDWKRYRIALNRLPEQAGYPDTVEWPVKPV